MEVLRWNKEPAEQCCSKCSWVFSLIKPSVRSICGILSRLTITLNKTALRWCWKYTFDLSGNVVLPRQNAWLKLARLRLCKQQPLSSPSTSLIFQELSFWSTSCRARKLEETQLLFQLCQKSLLLLFTKKTRKLHSSCCVLLAGQAKDTKFEKKLR